jgi:predicted TPR repeat methyltransferase
MSSSLPIQSQSNDSNVTEFFDRYFVEKLEFASNEVDAVIGFFDKRGFEKAAAISTGTILLQQAKLDEINVFTLLDTLKGFDEIKLSAVVAEVLNYNRLSTSVLGFKSTTTTDTLEKRNIAV